MEEVKKSSKTYTPRGTTSRKCPLCSGPLYPVRGKRGKTLLVCQGLSCGFEEEGGGDRRGTRPSGKEKRIARKLMNQYGKGGKETSTFGDLLKVSMERKKEREENS